MISYKYSSSRIILYVNKELRRADLEVIRKEVTNASLKILTCAPNLCYLKKRKFSNDKSINVI